MSFAKQPHKAMMAQADHDGVAVIVRADAGETRAMTQDRAWAIARSITAFTFTDDGDLDAAACEAACRAWVWSRHAGCGYDPACELDRTRRLVDAALRCGRSVRNEK